VPGPVVTKYDIEQASTQGAMPADQLAFIDAIMGVHRAPDTTERDAGMRERDAAEAAKFHRGNVAVGTLDVQDAAYFANMAGPYHTKTGADIRWAGVVGGTTAEINAFRSLGEAWRNNYPAADYDGPLKAIIAAMMGE